MTTMWMIASDLETNLACLVARLSLLRGTRDPGEIADVLPDILSELRKAEEQARDSLVDATTVVAGRAL